MRIYINIWLLLRSSFKEKENYIEEYREVMLI